MHWGHSQIGFKWMYIFTWKRKTQIVLKWQLPNLHNLNTDSMYVAALAYMHLKRPFMQQCTVVKSCLNRPAKESLYSKPSFYADLLTQ